MLFLRQGGRVVKALDSVSNTVSLRGFEFHLSRIVFQWKQFWFRILQNHFFFTIMHFLVTYDIKNWTITKGFLVVRVVPLKSPSALRLSQLELQKCEVIVS